MPLAHLVYAFCDADCMMLSAYCSCCCRSRSCVTQSAQTPVATLEGAHAASALWSLQTTHTHWQVCKANSVRMYMHTRREPQLYPSFSLLILCGVCRPALAGVQGNTQPVLALQSCVSMNMYIDIRGNMRMRSRPWSGVHAHVDAGVSVHIRAGA